MNNNFIFSCFFVMLLLCFCFSPIYASSENDSSSIDYTDYNQISEVNNVNMDSNHINDYSPNYHNLNKRFTSLELDKCVNYSKLDDNKHSENILYINKSNINFNKTSYSDEIVIDNNFLTIKNKNTCKIDNNSYSINSIINNTDYVNQYIIQNNSLPETIDINENNISFDVYMYYLCLIGITNTTSHFNDISYSNCNLENNTLSSEDVNNIALNLISYYENNNNTMPVSLVLLNNSMNMIDVAQILTNSIVNRNAIQLTSSNIFTVRNYDDIYWTLRNYNYPSITLKLGGTNPYKITHGILLNDTNTHNINIIGNNHILLAQQNISFLAMNSNYNVIIENVTIKNVNTNIFILNNGTLTIKNSKFQDNLESSGTLLYNIKNLSFINNIVQNNIFKYSMIVNNGKTFLDYNQFINNSADNGVVVTNVGGVVLLTNNICINNSAIWGGVAYNTGLYDDNSTLSLENNTLKNNNAINGGVIYNEKNLVLVNNIIMHNGKISSHNETEGGVICSFNGNIDLNNNTFSSNIANYGGVINMRCSILKSVNNIFINNHAECGGVIISNQSNMISMNNQIYNNSAKINGGYLINFDGIYYSKNDTLKNTISDCGAIFAQDYSTIIIRDSNIINNTAFNDGSVLKINKSTVIINNTRMYNNSAKNGGVIFANSENYITLNKVTFRNNTALIFGGAIYTVNSIIYSNNSMFNRTHANTGGAIYSTNSEIQLNKTLFDSNNAKFGGAITQLSERLTTITNSVFLKNNADYGGALYISKSPTLINQTKILQNTAKTGGAIYLTLSNILNIKNSQFKNNHAENTSLLKAVDSSILLNNNIITNNKTESELTLENTYYDINYNWWGTNTPQFTTITNKEKPNKWLILESKQTNNTLQINMNILNTGETYNDFNLSQTIKLTINNQTQNQTIFKTYTKQIKSTDNLKIKLDNEEINPKLNKPFFYGGDIKVESEKTIEHDIYISRDCNGSLIIKLNGKILKDENGNIIFAHSNHGIIKYPFHAPYTNKYTNYTITYILSENNNSYSFNNILTVTPSNKVTVSTIITPHKISYLDVDDQIITPNTNTTITIKTNKDINDKLTIKILNKTYTTNIVNGRSTLKINTINWTKYYNKIIKVHIIFKGNNNYLPSQIKINLYIQKNNTTFNLKNYGLVTSVKDQEDSPSCWAFATIGAIESAMLKQYNISWDLSENNLKNIINKYAINGSTLYPNEGSSLIKAVNYPLSWRGVVNEKEDPYIPSSVLSPVLPSKIHIQNIQIIPNRKNFKDNNEIKKAIIKYGAVLSECQVNSTAYAKNNTKAILNWYISNNSTPNHAILLVGWDDNYDRNNFANPAPENGAFIVKNSYGQEQGNYGYNYISYYDTSLGGFNKTTVSNMVFILNKTSEYDSIYQYETQSSAVLSNNSSIWIKNTFKSKNNEVIGAVGTYVLKPVNYTVFIYKNNNYQYEQSGEITSEFGYKTIELNSYIQLQENDNFTVVIKLTSQSNTSIVLQDELELTYENNNQLSYLSYDGKNWTDLKKYKLSACIKAYSKNISQFINIKDNNQEGNNHLFIITAKATIATGNLTYYLNNKPIKSLNNINIENNTFNYNIPTSLKETLFTVVIKTPYETMNQTIVVKKSNENTSISNNKLPDNIIKNETINTDFKNWIINTLNIPSYINITLPNVIESGNSTYDHYIIKSGKNGIIYIYTQRLINITVNGKTFEFSNVPDSKIKYILNKQSYYVNTYNNTIISCSKDYKPKNSGILLYSENKCIIIKFYQLTTESLNLFAVNNKAITRTYNATKLPRVENKMYCEEITTHLNNMDKVKTILSEGINYDERGLKYQLYLNNITNETFINYNNIKNFSIKYSFTKQDVIFNKDKIIRNIVCDKVTSRFTFENNTNTRNDILSFSNTKTYTRQVYTTTSLIINKTLFNKYSTIYRNSTYYNEFIVALRAIYFNDMIATTIQEITNTTWNRNTQIVLLKGNNEDKGYFTCLNPNMAMKITGNTSNIILFRLITSLALPEIEKSALYLNNTSYKSILSIITEGIDNNDYNIVENGSVIYIITNNEKTILSIDTNTGMIIDYNVNGGNINHGLNFNDSTQTTVGHYNIGSSEAELERVSATIIMSIGSTLLTVPGLQVPAVGIILVGCAISMDANGIFSNPLNSTRWADFGIDFVTSAIPYGKIFGFIEQNVRFGLVFKSFTNTISKATKDIVSGYDLIEGCIGATATFVGETLTLNDRDKTFLEVIYDSIVAIPSSELFTKSFTNIPFLSGRMIEKCSEESYKYTMKVFKAIFDYDTAEEIFKEVPKKIIKTLFTVEISKLILVNQLVKNYFDDLIKMEAIHMMNYTLFLLRKTYGMNLTYLDLTYVANTKTNQARISEYYATV